MPAATKANRRIGRLLEWGRLPDWQDRSRPGAPDLQKPRPILVFQHMPADRPGHLFDRLHADGIAWRILRLDLGEPIPDLRDFAALWVLGGPMDVWEEERLPWLVPEKTAIRRAVLDLGMPYFGVCLGHQLLADALGGHVGPAETPEIGVVDVRLNAEGRRHPLLETLPENAALLQWHLAEVQRPPDEAAILASSANCAVHALALGDRVLGLQSHIEIGLDTVEEWLISPDARAQLESNLGPDALPSFRAELQTHMPAMNRAADRLYERLIAAIGR